MAANRGVIIRELVEDHEVNPKQLLYDLVAALDNHTALDHLSYALTANEYWVTLDEDNDYEIVRQDND